MKTDNMLHSLTMGRTPRILTAAALSTLVSAPAMADEYTFQQYPLHFIHQDWGKPVLNRSVDGQPIVMAGKSFNRGIGTHAKSRIEVQLDGKATSFQSTVGISNSKTGSRAKVEFKVVGDNRVLWSSGLMTPASSPMEVKVPLEGVRALSLVVEDAGNGIADDHVNWAEPVIQYDGETPKPGGNAFVLEGASFNWAIHTDASGRLQLAGLTDHAGGWSTPLRGLLFPGGFDVREHEAPVRVRFANGDTALNLVYRKHEITRPSEGVTEAVVHLEDAVNPVKVRVHLKHYRDEDVLERWSVVENATDKPIQIDLLESGYWTIPAARDVHLEWWDSHWSKEAEEPTCEKLGRGRKIIESRGGLRHITGPVPAFVLGFGARPDESKTPCMVSALAWPGSARMSFDTDSAGTLAVAAGVGTGGWPVSLAPGGSLSAPAWITTFSAHGKGAASRNLHAWTRKHYLRDGNRIRLVDNNSWEGCFFNVNEESIMDMMRRSADVGVELYVLDDGWFGNGVNARINDTAGLGDWQVNRERFPNGLGVLVKKAREFGIEFGLWFEPEMINPKSDLYASKPEWVLRNPGRELTLGRNQAVLDLANPEVKEFVFKAVDDVLTASPGIRFVKWDANCDINNPWSPYLGAERQGELSHLYVENYLSVLKRLVDKHPGTDFQACSSGGGRADFGAIRHSHNFWVSDNTNPMYRLRAQWNFSTLFPAIATTCHVTHAGDFSTKFRFDVSMMGQLGLELDPRKSTPEHLADMKAGVSDYKKVREVIQLGIQYRHQNPFESTTPSLNYVSPDGQRAVLLAYQTGECAGELLAQSPIAGLDPKRRYQAVEINLPPGDSTPRMHSEGSAIRTGEQWMADGIRLRYGRKHDSAAILFSAVE